MLAITEDDIISFRKDPYCLYLKTGHGIYRIANWRAGLQCERWSNGVWTSQTQDPDITPLASLRQQGGASVQEWFNMAIRDYNYAGSAKRKRTGMTLDEIMQDLYD